MSLLNYWPTLEEVDKCIKSEAESASDEVLLAVHQQFPIAYSKVGADGKVMAESRKLATEDELLSHLLGSAPEGSLVVPITGASGVGKSHLIRILDARLRKVPEASRYLVIRIPKSASLKRVVELILEAEPLQGEGYKTIREEFSKALADVPLDQAVILFQAQLEIALKEFAASLQQQLKQNPTNELLKGHLHVARNLPEFISDAATKGYFQRIVLPRIIHRSVQGVTDQGNEINATDSQFQASDFDLPDDVQIGQAALQVRNFYQMTLCTMGGKGKVLAAEVLNSVVDQATRQLYKLHESLGGKTLGEVIGDIRRLILEENPKNELIILVEDFAALVGIQDTLAKILIQHGQTDGKQTLATIRSVIAVTDGYLAGRDTLATRAGREWVVESRLERERETLSRTGSLVASYLNAARHGESVLKELYRQADFEKNHSFNKNVTQVYSEDVGDCGTSLQAFGYVSEIPLFPFTEAAIECLARSALAAGNTLVFNPRFVIKNVIREVLIQGREAFQNNQFPPPGVNGKPLSGEVAHWLSSQTLSTEQKKRYERLLSVWGNSPRSLRDISIISPYVFDAFSLPRPNLTIDPAPPSPLPTEKLGGDETFPPPLPPPQVDQYRLALERWVQDGTKLEQTIANKIRQSLATLVNRSIDWNAERCLKREIRADKFSIPNAAGQAGLSVDAVSIAATTEDPDGRLRGELLALLRFADVHNGSADYAESDDDLARVSNLIDRLLPDLLASVRLSIGRQTRSAITLLAANSRILGLTEKGRTPGVVSSFLFGEFTQMSALPDTAPQPFKEWRSLQVEATQIREQLKQLVLETSGCFQGTGKTTYGVDILRVIEHYPTEGAVLDLADVPSISPELRTTLNRLRQQAVESRCNQLLVEAKTIQKRITDDLGADFDKQEVIKIVSEVAASLKTLAAWNLDAIGVSTSEFSDMCEAFRNSALKEALSILEGALNEQVNQMKNSHQRIGKSAQLPLEALLVANQFLTYTAKVVKAAAAHAKVLETQYGDVSPSDKAEELVETFNQLTSELRVWE